MNNDKHPYDDIIKLPHHVSRTHPQMPRQDRAAQFAPFAALTGYDAAILEAARLTDRRVELDESRKQALDARLQLLRQHLGQAPELTVCYFVPDRRKSGGAYVSHTGTVKKIDELEKSVVFRSGLRISIEDILDLQSDLFAGLEP